MHRSNPVILVLLGIIFVISSRTTFASYASVTVGLDEIKLVAFQPSASGTMHTLDINNGAQPCFEFVDGDAYAQEDGDMTQWQPGTTTGNLHQYNMTGASPDALLWLTVDGKFQATQVCQANGGGGIAQQHNFGVKLPDVDLSAPTQNQEFAFDMAGPTMPTIQLTAVLKPADQGVEYRFEVGNNGRALEYEDAPPGYEHPAPIDSGWVNNAAWNINFGNFVYGGHITHIKVSVRKGGQVIASRVFQRDVWVLGAGLTGAMRNG